MSKKINSASRLHSILTLALSEGDKTPILEVWAKLLRVDELAEIRRAAMVSERLYWMHHELGLVAEQMLESGYSASLYGEAMSNIEHAISTMILPGQWQQAKQYLRSDALLALAFCSEILPDEESQISEDELSQIQALVNELRSSLSTSDLPSRLTALIQHHIELIERALAEYPITGARALREAARTGLGELLEAKDTVKVSRDTNEIRLLEAVWKNVNKAADIALKAEKISQLGQKAWAILEKIF